MNKKVQQRIVGLCLITIAAIAFLPLVLPDGSPEPEQNVPWKPLPARPKTEAATPLAVDQIKLEQEFKQLKQRLEDRNDPPSEVVSAQAVERNKDFAAPAVKPVAEKQRPQTSQATQLKPAWVIQLATLSSEDSAKRLVDKLHQQKIPAFYRQRKTQSKTLWRVMAGPELEKKLLEPYQQKLVAEFPDLKIIGYTPLG